jgi:hypothetical protein
MHWSHQLFGFKEHAALGQHIPVSVSEMVIIVPFPPIVLYRSVTNMSEK